MNKILVVLVLIMSMLNANNYVLKESKYSVDKSIENIEVILKQNKITIFGIIDHNQNARDVNLELQQSKLIIFGNPMVGTKMMRRDIRVGLELPLKILVYEDGGKTYISYIKPETLRKNYNLDQCHLINKLTKVLEKITLQAIE